MSSKPQVADSARCPARGTIFVLSGPSGSGKTTLARAVLADKSLGRSLVRSISFTTRPRRRGEREGKDYFFLTSDEFRRNLRGQKILEWTRYLGYYYGTARDFVDRTLQRSKGLILCLDLKGAQRIKSLYPKDSVTVFVMPPSLEELFRRIQGRRRETGAEIRKRIAVAKREIAACGSYDYCLVNSDLRRAITRLKTIIRQNMH
ncbi:MAG: guanylate kinase [Candidatus Omnitrophica bacterium]|nr:guanylate kinase [Candidatus Omnitrophota bacterium]